jgi:hypothetical protein
MTDRYNALTVALDRDIRDDDAEVIINAIKAIRGVSDVTGNIVDIDSYVATSRISTLVGKKLHETMKEIQEIK